MRTPHSSPIFLDVQSNIQKSSTNLNSPSLRLGTSGVKVITLSRTNASVPHGWKRSWRQNRIPSDWSFVSVDMELTNQCGSECRMCPREFITRPKGMMSEDVFNIGNMEFYSSSITSSLKVPNGPRTFIESSSSITFLSGMRILIFPLIVLKGDFESPTLSVLPSIFALFNCA